MFLFQSGKDKVVNLLIKMGANVNAEDKHSMTPLFSAACECKFKCFITQTKS